MTEWKPEPQTPEQVEQGLKDAMKQAKEDGVFDRGFDDWYKTESPSLMINNPKLSNWTCYLFGGSPGDGIAYTPVEGQVPNRFVRFMTRICFACTWVKKDD